MNRGFHEDGTRRVDDEQVEGNKARRHRAVRAKRRAEYVDGAGRRPAVWEGNHCMPMRETSARAEILGHMAGAMKVKYESIFHVGHDPDGRIPVFPIEFFMSLAVAAAQVVAPCPACAGRGVTSAKADFIDGEGDPKLLDIGEERCRPCEGTGVDPEFWEAAYAWTAGSCSATDWLRHVKTD